MASACPLTSIHRANTGASLNVTKLLLQRYNDSPKDDRERLGKCWGYNDCGDCHRSDGFCGWCGLTSTCLPLPNDAISRALPLLTPIRHKFICPQVGERFELRTAGLGCQVSTITFLTSIVTIFSTLLGVLVLYLLLRCAKWISSSLRAQKGGYALCHNAEQWEGVVWARQQSPAGDLANFHLEYLDPGLIGDSWAWWGGKQTGKYRARSRERRPLLREPDL